MKLKKKKLIVLIFITFFPLFASAQEIKKPNHKLSFWKNLLPPLEQGEKWTKKDSKYAQRVMDFMKGNLKEITLKSSTPKFMKRDAHPKHHGCVKANVTFNNQLLPAKYRLGLFSNSLNGKSFPSIIRYSNSRATSEIRPDISKDGRGMAIKIMNLPMKNYLSQIKRESTPGVQDFLMANGSVFVVNGVRQYFNFIKASRGKGFQKFKFFINPRNWNTFPNLSKILVKIGNPLHLNYFTQVPYKLGNTAMKVQFKSCTPEKNWDKVPENPQRDFLKLRLAKTLSNGNACFHMLIQPRTKSKKMPLDNPTKDWSQKASPFIKVATVTIPKQSAYTSKNEMEKCEKISFHPWRAHPLHRPMGSLNRLRLMIYSNQFEMRNEYNQKNGF